MKFENLKATNKVFERLNKLRRWSNLITEGKYDEISKQALNCISTFILAVEAEKRGAVIAWERFPKIAIFRAFQKAYVNYDTPEHILKEICDLGGIKFDIEFVKVTLDIIAQKADKEFALWLKEGCGTYEEHIYKGGTKIATFLELKELQRNINGDYSIKYEEVVRSMVKYEDIPGFKELSDAEGNYFKVLESFSKLRNQNRWAAYYYLVDCSVLGHLFDTACFAYLMALENGESEEVATKFFFMGIFHDVPEAFTKDIPSPIKDRIPRFRELTEKYELKMMEKFVYPLVSEEVEDALRDVMFEDEDNACYKKLMKGADYISAVSELYRQLKAGSRDENFVDAMNLHKQRFEDAEVTQLTPSTEKLLKWMVDYANSLNL